MLFQRLLLLAGIGLTACGGVGELPAGPSEAGDEPAAPGTPPVTGDGAPPALKTDQVIVAHRGASAYAPEHTIPAYDMARRMGAEYIEQDVLMTSDGVLVCIHDDTLDRTARGPEENCTGNVGDKTLGQLKTCDMGSWFNEAYPERARPEYVGLQIPTLEEVFQRYGKAANYYIEIKPNTDLSSDVEQTLLNLIKQYDLYTGMVQKRQVLVQSFIPTSLLTMNSLDPNVPLVQLYPGGTQPTLRLVASYAFGIGPTKGETNETLVTDAHELGLAVHPYTVNSQEELEAMAELCVDGVFTNHPDRYRAVLAAKDYGCPAPIR